MKINLDWLSEYVDLPNPAEELVDVLPMLGIEVEENDDSGLGDWLLIMDTLWDILKRKTSPGFLSQRKYLRLSVHTKYNRLFSLPLSENTLKVLFETDPKETLTVRLKQQNLPQSEIEQEIEILFTMGFCSFLSPEERRRTQPTIQQIELQNEEEGWKKISTLTPLQNFTLDKASPHFWRTLLDRQQNIQSSPKKSILKLLKAHCFIEVFTILKSSPSPSWEELQLICWVSLNIDPNAT